ncbi:MAG TPA: hypothetical protein VKZ88_00770, partial [Fibrobacteria bacterium]|nr:hypothetical protein [Fibrobacteria bacterium]
MAFPTPETTPDPSLTPTSAPECDPAFSANQKEYLEGFLRGQFVAQRTTPSPDPAETPLPYSAREGLG